jgi:MFS family permease
VDPVAADRSRWFDRAGAALSALGMFFVVIGILQAGTNRTLMFAFLALGAALITWFFVHIRAAERAGKEPLLSTSLFRNRTTNLALVTQNVQWLMLMGMAFVVSVFLQVVRGYSAIQTGLVFSAATVGLLVSSLSAQALAGKYSQRALICVGFIMTIAGNVLVLGLVGGSRGAIVWLPGLLLAGLGVGTMLTPSVNVVQSSFPEEQQGEISGLSRSVSNLGSSLGTAIAGTILVSSLASGNRSYQLALMFLSAMGLVGLIAALLLPRGGSGPRSAL